jgi:hypothetical protein
MRPAAAVGAIRPALGLAVALASACGPQTTRKPGVRQWTSDMEFTITTDPSPPRARESTIFTVEARDKSSHQPIEGADGRIYAGTKDGASTYDGLIPGLKPGTYSARIRFVTAGDWSVGLQFRRDTMDTNPAAIVTTQTWTQQVLSASDEPIP